MCYLYNSRSNNFRLITIFTLKCFWDQKYFLIFYIAEKNTLLQVWFIYNKCEVLEKLHLVFLNWAIWLRNKILPWDITPSSRSACHIIAACALVWILGERFSNQSTNSVPGAHLLTNLPDTFRSLRQVFLAETEKTQVNVMSNEGLLEILIYLQKYSKMTWFLWLPFVFFYRFT